MSSDIWRPVDSSTMPTVEVVSGVPVTQRPPINGSNVNNNKPVEEVGRLRRGFSKASSNFPIITRAREIVLSDVAGSGNSEDHPQHIVETPVYTFVLPNINAHPDGFKAFLYKELIEMPTLVSLEQGGFLNWWADIGIGPRLYPMLTTGDGNCLLHAASLAMWGFHDRQLTLRKLLARNMSGGVMCDAFQRRWRWQQMQANKQCGLVMSEAEWQQEWQFLIRLACPEPKNCTSNNVIHQTSRSLVAIAGQSNDTEAVFESLEEFHVFILAHVLRRPIIVIAKSILTDCNGEAMAPIPFGGVFLPLECEPSVCHRSPLLLTYDAGHFCALVWMDGADGELTIPVVNPKLEVLPIHFVTDPGLDFDWSKSDSDEAEFALSLDERMELLEQYMDIKLVPLSPFGGAKHPGTGSGHVRHGSYESTPISALEDDRKVGVHRRQIQDVVKSFGSLGQTVSKKIKRMGMKTRKDSVGSATQCSRKNTLAVEMLADSSQVLCAGLVKRGMFHQDDFIRNYLEQATQRFAELRAFHQQQTAELNRRLSTDFSQRHDPDNSSLDRPISGPGQTVLTHHNPPSSSEMFPKPSQMYHGPLPPLERQNTLFLTGKSKFYTMCYEEHCQSPVSVPQTESKPDHKLRRTKTTSTKAKTEPALRTVITVRSASDKRIEVGSVVDNVPKYDGTQKHRTAVVDTTGAGTLTGVQLPAGYRMPSRLLASSKMDASSSHSRAGYSYSLPNPVLITCPHGSLPNSDCPCSVCFQAKRYSSLVGYQTAYTKL